DAGNSQTCTVRDQRLAPRVGTCDIGSVEGGSKAPVGPIPGNGDDTDAMSALVIGEPSSTETDLIPPSPHRAPIL
ncbi:hypothetical protein, partial [Thiolapillus sp.]